MSKRGKAEENTRQKWWNAGHSLAGRASTKPENQGLDDRAQQGLEGENAKPWGLSTTAETIRGRHRHRMRT